MSQKFRNMPGGRQIKTQMTDLRKNEIIGRRGENYVTEDFDRQSTRSDRTLLPGIVLGNIFFASGQIPIDPATGEIHGTTIEEQAEQVMKNIGELLKAAGTDYTRVAKTSCFLADMGDFAAFNQVYAKYFTENPARSCVAVKTLPKNVLCEVEVIAEV